MDYNPFYPHTNNNKPPYTPPPTTPPYYLPTVLPLIYSKKGGLKPPTIPQMKFFQKFLWFLGIRI